jgi:hypothetical protein
MSSTEHLHSSEDFQFNFKYLFILYQAAVGKKSGSERFRYSHVLFYLVLISILGRANGYAGTLRGFI